MSNLVSLSTLPLTKVSNVFKTILVATPTGKNVQFGKLIALNNSGGAADLGFGYQLSDSQWVAGHEVIGDSGKLFLDTTDAQDAGADDFKMIDADGEATVFGATEKFNVVGITIGVAMAGTGSLTTTLQYWNGSWTTLTAIAEPDWEATPGDIYLMFLIPTDWALATLTAAFGGESTTTEDDGIAKYWIRIDQDYATSLDTDPEGTIAWLGTLVDLELQVADNGKLEHNGWPLVIPARSQGLVAYFGTADAGNAVAGQYDTRG